MFTQEQLVSSLRETILLAPAIHTAVLVDVEQLHKDILAALSADSVAQSHLLDSSDSRWSKDSTGLLHLDDRIYVPDTNDLHLRVLHYKHDHPLAGHLSKLHSGTSPPQVHLAWCLHLRKGLHKFLHFL